MEKLLTNGIFRDNDLWTNMRELAKKSQYRQVAVAYIGKEASKMLPLQKGDVLIISDLSKTSVKNGLVNPYEVEKFIIKGVDVHSYSGLHSKIYLFDNVVIVGSANLSKHSKEDLVEAAIISDNRDLIKKTRKFMERLIFMGKPVTLETVRKLKERYQPPKFEARSSERKAKPDLWITSVWTEDYPEEDREEVKKKEKELERSVDKDKDIYTIWDIVDRGFDWKVDDLIVQIYRKNGRVKVIGPSRVKELYKRPKYIYSFLLAPGGRKWEKTWKEFKKVMNKAGYRRISKNSHRLVKSDKVKEAIYDLFEL